jgi:hypothetical protein
MDGASREAAAALTSLPFRSAVDIFCARQKDGLQDDHA